MVWLLFILQVAFISIGRWVYDVFLSQPRYNHPPVFWNPATRFLLLYGPFFGAVGLVIAAFYLTGHPWLFLIFSIVFFLIKARATPKTTLDTPVVTVLGEDGISLERMAADELIEDIRAWKNETHDKSEA